MAEIGIERELIFCMIADGSSAEWCRVLTSLSRTIVGGGRQRRGRLVKLCGVPGGRFAVVAKSELNAIDLFQGCRRESRWAAPGLISLR